MRVSALSLLFVVSSLQFFATSSYSQNPSPSLSPKLVTASCGKPVCTWNAFGPNSYARQTGKPETVIDTFSVLNPNTQYTLHIDNNGVAGAVISVNGTEVFGPSDFGPSVQALDRPVTLASSNTVTVELRSKPGTSLTVTVIGVDNDPPSVAEFAVPSPNVFGWNNTNVAISFACGDAASGVALCPSPFVLATEGQNQIAAGTVFDRAGNSTTSSVQVSIDKTPPAIAASQSPLSNTFNWNNTPVTVSFACADNLSSVQGCTAPVTVSTEGARQNVSGSAADFAGNTANTVAIVNIDLTPPTITASALPAPNAAGWNNSAVTVSFSCADALSGVASCPSPVNVSSEGANQPVSGAALDKAGNSGNVSLNLNIDLTPPVVAITSPADGSTVTAANISVGGTVSDALSGVRSVQCNGVSASVSSGAFLCQVSLQAGANTLQITATDVAGNQVTSSRTVMFQAAPPVPINAIFITPDQINLLAGQTRPLTVVSDQGQPVNGATFTISDPTVLQITNGQISALQAGTVTITASLEGHTASANAQVFSGTQLPLGTPLWSNSPLPGNKPLGGVFADNRTGTGPDIYSLERSSDGLVVRALSSDGRQLWSTPINADTLQTALSTSSLSQARAQATVAGGQAPAGISVAGLIDNATSTNDLESLLQKMRAAGGRSTAEADFAFDIVKEIIASPFEQRRKAALEQATKFGPSAAVALRAPGTQTTTQADTSTTSTVTLALFFNKLVPDPQGGLLVHLSRVFGSFTDGRITGITNKDSLIRIDPITQRMSWSYDTDSMSSGFAVRDDGTIFAFKFFVSQPPFPGQPFTTGNAYVGVDLLTGVEKFNVPPSGELVLQNASGGIFFSCPCVQTGAIAIDQDGNAQVTYATRTVKLPASGPGVTTFVTTAISTLNQLTLDGTGGSSTQVLKSLTTTATTFTTANGTVLRTVIQPNTLIGAGETIPDGVSGLLDAWTLETVQGSDCVFPVPFQSQCTPIGSSGFDARIIHGANEYSLQPLQGFSDFGFRFENSDFGAALALGNGNTAFAFNGFQLNSYQTDTGTSLWSAPVSSTRGQNKLIAAIQDGGVLIGLDTGHLSRYDSLGNPTVFDSFTFFFSDIDPDGNLMGLDGAGNTVVQPAIAPLASSNWQRIGGNHGERDLVLPKLTISKILPLVTATGLLKSIPLIGIANGQQESVQITSNELASQSSASKIKISIETAHGTSGSATFSDGSTEMTITPTVAFPSVIQIKGVEASSIADNISLIAKVGQAEILRQKFSVVSVSLRINPTGHVTTDDSVRDAYIQFSGVGSDQLGSVIIPLSAGGLSGCRIAVEIVGDVKPANYQGKVILRRNLLEASDWDQTTFLRAFPFADDTSFPDDRDDNPSSSNAHVYDIDLPGLKNASLFLGKTRRFRNNFSEYAVLDFEQNTVPVSEKPLSWYSRDSCIVTNAGPVFLNDISGDNQAGQGCTKLSLDLQSNDHAGSVCTQ